MAIIGLAPDPSGGTTLPRPVGRLDVEGVTYIPPGLREPVVRQASFRLDGGEMLGVVGPSGAGKTTLVRLVVGSLSPSVGHVRLDGAEMRAWPAADRGRYVGYLPQSVELFAGTVRDNIARLGAARDEEVIAAFGPRDEILEKLRRPELLARPRAVSAPVPPRRQQRPT